MPNALHGGIFLPMKKPVKSFLSCLLFSLSLNAAAIAAEPQFQNGDIILQTSQSAQSQVIQIASGSNLSHVGIIEVLPGGQRFVVEAISSVSRTPLASWIARGKDGKYVVYRRDGLSPGQGQALVAAAKGFLGRGYDLYFSSHNSEIYCSELVDLAARKIGIQIGSYQAFGTLNVNDPRVIGMIQQRWRGHPLCRGMGSFEQCWGAVMRDQLITPVALTRDPKMRKVYSNYSWFGW